MFMEMNVNFFGIILIEYTGSYLDSVLEGIYEYQAS